MRERINQLALRSEPEIASPTECSVMAADELANVLRALRELPARYRKVFLLHQLQEQSTVEIAARLQVSDRMVRIYIQRAREYCRLRCDGIPKRHARRRIEL